MTQRASSAHWPAIPTQDILRIPPPSHRSSRYDRSGEYDPYPLVWSEKQRRTKRKPGSVSSEDTTSSTWSIQKPIASSIPAASCPRPQQPLQILLNKDPQTDGKNISKTSWQQEQSEPPHLAVQSVANHATITGYETTRYNYVEDQRRTAYEAGEDSDHAMWILLWLCFLDPIMSLFSAAVTVITVLLLTISYPVIHLCHLDTSSFGTLLIRTLAPLFRYHLRLFYAPSVDDMHTFDFSSTRLVLVHLISPLLSIGVCVAAWIAGAFWLFTWTMGNPDGTEIVDDGHAAVLAVRDWWERFHLYAIRYRFTAHDRIP